MECIWNIIQYAPERLARDKRASARDKIYKTKRADLEPDYG